MGVGRARQGILQLHGPDDLWSAVAIEIVYPIACKLRCLQRRYSQQGIVGALGVLEPGAGSCRELSAAPGLSFISQLYSHLHAPCGGCPCAQVRLCLSV